ncbi:MAG: glutaredoxin [Colwellia sp.]|nr:glutaredoxin [Colwellia sp.]
MAEDQIYIALQSDAIYNYLYRNQELDLEVDNKEILNKIKNEKWVLITRPGCGYCTKTKNLIISNGGSFEEITQNDPRGDELIQSHFGNNITNTYPVVFRNDQPVSQLQNGILTDGYSNIKKMYPRFVPNSSTSNIPSPQHVEETSFRGKRTEINHAILFLLNKYPLACSPLVDGTPAAIQHNFLTKQLTYSSGFDKGLIKCYLNETVRFIIIFLSLHSNVNRTGKSIGHANFLIFDKQDRTLEYFEPYGLHGDVVEFSRPHVILRKIKVNINKILMDKTILNKSLEAVSGGSQKLVNQDRPIRDVILPLEFCPQTIENEELNKHEHDPGGFCGAWVIWYADLRLGNPDIPRDYLVVDAVNYIVGISTENDISFKTYIRNYSEYLSSQNELFVNTFKSILSVSSNRSLVEMARNHDNPSALINFFRNGNYTMVKQISVINNYVDVLHWGLNLYVPIFELSQQDINEAAKLGYVDILNIGVNSSLSIIPSVEAMNEAAGNNHLNVMIWGISVPYQKRGPVIPDEEGMNLAFENQDILDWGKNVSADLGGPICPPKESWVIRLQ